MIVYKYVVFGIVVFLSGLISFLLLDPQQSATVYKYSAYPITLFTFCILILALIRARGSKQLWGRDMFNLRTLPLILTFVAVVAVLFANGTWGFKAIMDEPLIVSTSQNLHFNRVPLLSWRAYNIEGVFTITDSLLDKRPIPFAVLISLVHDLTGYRPENAFILNNLIGLASIALIGLLGYKIHGRIGACLGMVLLGGLPVFIYYSNGAGFDVFNIFMTMVVILLGLRWYSEDTQWSLVAFMFAGVILCQSRYEAAIFVLPIGLTVLYKWWRDRSIQLPWILILVPVIMMLIPLQHAVFQINQGFWELESIPEADKVFGWRYFYPNLGHAISYLWDWSDIYPNSPYLSWLGIFSFVALTTKIGYRIKGCLQSNPGLFIWISFAAGLAVHFFLTMVFFYGQFDSPMLYRFSLPIYLLAVLLSIACLKVLPSVWMKQGILIFAFIGWFAYSIPVSAKQYYGKTDIHQLYYNWIGDFAKKNRDKYFLIIDNNPIPWILNSVSATSYGSANVYPGKLKYQLEKGSFDSVLVTVLIGSDPQQGDNRYISESVLSEGFKKEFISRKKLHPFYFVDLYRLVDVDVEKINALTAIKSSKDNSFVGEDLETESFKFSEEKKARQEYYLNLP